jgi:hypothetical protein
MNFAAIPVTDFWGGNGQLTPTAFSNTPCTYAQGRCTAANYYTNVVPLPTYQGGNLTQQGCNTSYLQEYPVSNNPYYSVGTVKWEGACYDINNYGTAYGPFWSGDSSTNIIHEVYGYPRSDNWMYNRFNQ